MMKEEFEKIAGYEVSEQDYHDIIEPMYLASKLDKQDFVKCVNKKRFALRPLKSIVKEMKELAAHLKDTCTHYTDFESRNRLEDLAREYVQRKYGFGYAHGTHEVMIQSCFYIESIEIFGRWTYKTIETIELV